MPYKMVDTGKTILVSIEIVMISLGDHSTKLETRDLNGITIGRSSSNNNNTDLLQMVTGGEPAIRIPQAYTAMVRLELIPIPGNPATETYHSIRYKLAETMASSIDSLVVRTRTNIRIETIDRDKGDLTIINVKVSRLIEITDLPYRNMNKIA